MEGICVRHFEKNYANPFRNFGHFGEQNIIYKIIVQVRVGLAQEGFRSLYKVAR